MLGAAWPEDEIRKDVGVPPACPVSGPRPLFCPAVTLSSSPSPGKLPKCRYAKGQKATDSSLALCCATPTCINWQEKPQRERGARDCCRGVVVLVS